MADSELNQCVWKPFKLWNNKNVQQTEIIKET